MPQNSSYYTDLQIPTVNSDGSTYGTLINEFLNGLLIKLKDLSDRVTAAQGQLTDINRGTNAVDRINNTFAGVVGSNALVSGSWTTLYPDPYSGSYTKTTTWPAYASELTSYSPPTTQSEIENFDYQGFASVLQSKLDLIQGRVDQAEADILQSQINTCRTKKVLDAIGSSTAKGWQQQSSFSVKYQQQRTGTVGSERFHIFFGASSYGYASQHNSTLKSQLATYPSLTTVYHTDSFPSATGFSLGQTVLFCATSPNGTSPTYTDVWPFATGIVPNRVGVQGKVGYIADSPNSEELYLQGRNTLFEPGTPTLEFRVYQVVNVPVNGLYDLTRCNNPSPPYFI